MTTVKPPAQAPSPYQKKVFTILIGFVVRLASMLLAVGSYPIELPPLEQERPVWLQAALSTQ